MSDTPTTSWSTICTLMLVVEVTILEQTPSVAGTRMEELSTAVLLEGGRNRVGVVLPLLALKGPLSKSGWGNSDMKQHIPNMVTYKIINQQHNFNFTIQHCTSTSFVCLSQGCHNHVTTL